jgi:hypothetical protein
MKDSQDSEAVFDQAFDRVVQLGNELADDDDDVWDVADGILAGAIQYWLYSRQPCGDLKCEECLPVSTAEGRMRELTRLLGELAQQSEYYHSPSDANVGRA